MKKRDEVPVESTWDLRLLFETEEKFEQVLKETEEEVDFFAKKYEGNVETPAKIKEALADFRGLMEKMTHVGTYAYLDADVNVFNREAQMREAMVRNKLAVMGSKLSFLETDLAQLPVEVLEEAAKNEEDKVYLKKLIKDKPHLLSKAEEKLLASLANTINFPYESYNDIKFKDINFPNVVVGDKDIPMTYNSFEGRMEGEVDTNVRREAFRVFSETLAKYQNGTASAYNAQIQTEKTLSNLRGYESVFDFLLSDQDVSQELYHRQLDVIMEELAPHMRRYAKLIGKIHGLDKMTYADLKLDVDPTYSPKVSFEEAKKYILDGLSILGDEYLGIINDAFDNRWIDYAETLGKRTGAYCSSPYGANSFILTSFTESMSDVMTLSHELGHAGHFQLAHGNQNIMNAECSMYFVEAPSTTNELILANYLIGVAGDDLRMKRWVLSQMVSKTYYHNFVTHFMEGYYQREVYRLVDGGESLDAEMLNDLFRKTLEKFWGDAVEITEGAELTWMRQPHYYMGLYPYTYSAGLTIGTQMAKKLRTEGKAIAENWVRILKLGGSLPPEKLAKEAMVDVSTDKPLKETIAYIGSLIDEIEEITRKLNA
ncbi:MAG: oligoendopeptidase F [Tissierellia bacterium]|nr:oligoendopeptidase F [Tissierellia bacterium]